MNLIPFTFIKVIKIIHKHFNAFVIENFMYKMSKQILKQQKMIALYN